MKRSLLEIATEMDALERRHAELRAEFQAVALEQPIAKTSGRTLIVAAKLGTQVEWRWRSDALKPPVKHLFLGGIGACQVARRYAPKMSLCTPPTDALDTCTNCAQWARMHLPSQEKTA